MSSCLIPRLHSLPTRRSSELTVSATPTGTSTSSPTPTVTPTTPSGAATLGQFGPTMTWPIVAVNTALLRTGEVLRSEEHTSELQSLRHLVCRLLLEKKKANSI